MAAVRGQRKRGSIARGGADKRDPLSLRLRLFGKCGHAVRKRYPCLFAVDPQIRGGFDFMAPIEGPAAQRCKAGPLVIFREDADLAPRTAPDR